MKAIRLRKKRRQTIFSLLSKREFESVELISMVEKTLLELRGYVVSFPTPKTPVILLASGGLDSIITWALLLHVYKLTVYPLFINGGLDRSKNEKKSVNYFDAYFQKNYPELSMPVFEFTASLYPKELRQSFANPMKYFHPLHLLDVSVLHGGQVPVAKMPNRNIPATQPIFAQCYAHYLEDRYNIKIRTLFNGIMTGDGTVLSTQTMTAQRAQMLSLCAISHDYSWQWMSLSMEPELGLWLEKSDFIRYGSQIGLPLEKTWSCFGQGNKQCGEKCIACISRKIEFENAGIVDKTIYSSGENSVASTISNTCTRSLLKRFKELLPNAS